MLSSWGWRSLPRLCVHYKHATPSSVWYVEQSRIRSQVSSARQQWNMKAPFEVASHLGPCRTRARRNARRTGISAQPATKCGRPEPTCHPLSQAEQQYEGGSSILAFSTPAPKGLYIVPFSKYLRSTLLAIIVYNDIVITLLAPHTRSPNSEARPRLIVSLVPTTWQTTPRLHY